MAKKEKPSSIDYYMDQADKIRKQAEKDGVINNFLFMTTFDRYVMKIKYIEELRKEIDEKGKSTEKTYNCSTNEVQSPAYKNFLATCDSINKDGALLCRITEKFKKELNGAQSDPLVDLLNGDGDIE